jgi:hypothetical protein
MARADDHRLPSNACHAPRPPAHPQDPPVGDTGFRTSDLFGVKHARCSAEVPGRASPERVLSCARLRPLQRLLTGVPVSTTRPSRRFEPLLGFTRIRTTSSCLGQVAGASAGRRCVSSLRSGPRRHHWLVDVPGLGRPAEHCRNRPVVGFCWAVVGCMDESSQIDPPARNA